MGSIVGQGRTFEMNIWPFSKSTERMRRKEKFERLEREASDSRKLMYDKLFALDDMVKRSLVLLEPKRREPPSP
jgi:hypothetical protein